MADCCVLQAALKYNPLFPLCPPHRSVGVASDPTSQLAASSPPSPSLERTEQEFSDVSGEEHPVQSPTPVESNRCSTMTLDGSSENTQSDTVSGHTEGAAAGVAMSESRRNKRRRENKQRKMAALVNLINLNDASSRELSPSRKSRRLDDSTTDNNVATDSMKYTELKATVKKKRPNRKRPSVLLNSVGDSACLLMSASTRTPLFFRDIQTLLLNAVAPDFAPWPSRWCSLRHVNSLSAVVAVVADGLSLSDFEQNRELFSTTHTLFPIQFEVVSPLHYGTCSAEELINVSLTCSQRQRLINQLGGIEKAETSGLVERRSENSEQLPSGLPRHVLPARVTRDQLLLDVTQLVEEGYPLPGVGNYSRQYEGFVPTKDIYKPVHARSPMFSIDCEMCMTREGSELTLISVLDEHETLIYNSLVKPRNPIIDYVTKYSGVTAEMLRGVTTRLEDVQQHVRKIIPADAILIGQSLGGDLRAMKMLHPYVIDTSCIFNITGQRWRKSKLAMLSKIFLGETIQTGTDGHDPTEDALAALRLVHVKLQHGHEYGDAVQGGHVPPLPDDEPKADESAEVGDVGGMQTAAYSVGGVYTNLLSRVHEVGVTTSVVATGSSVEIYRVAAQSTNNQSIQLNTFSSNKQVSEYLPTAMAASDLTLGHWQVTAVAAEERQRQLYRLNKRLRRLFRAAPDHSLILLLGSGSRHHETQHVDNGFCLLAVKQTSRTNADSSAISGQQS